MTLVELVLAVALAGGATLIIGNVVRQMTTGAATLEKRSGRKTEAALAVLRMRSELKEAVAITSTASSTISFAHPDLTGDGALDVVTYAWDGTSGSSLTRKVNDGSAEPLLTDCVSLQIGTLGRATTGDELLAGHYVYGPGVTVSPQTFSVSDSNWAVELFSVSRSGATTARVTRARVFVVPGTAGIITAELRSVVLWSPSSTVLESSSRAVSHLPATGGWCEFVFPGATDLSTGGTYALVIRGDSSNSVGSIQYDYVTSGTPPMNNDYFRYTTSGGSLWVPTFNLSLRDMRYFLYGRYYSSTGTALTPAATPVRLVPIRIVAGPQELAIRLDAAVDCVNFPEVAQ